MTNGQSWSAQSSSRRSNLECKNSLTVEKEKQKEGWWKTLMEMYASECKLNMIRTELGHLQVFECEDHWLSEKHSARLFVDGGSDYMGVDRQALLILARPFHVHFHRCVLGGQKGSQVFIENEYHLDLSCTQRERYTKRWKERKRKAQNVRTTVKRKGNKKRQMLYGKGGTDWKIKEGKEKKTKYRNGGVIW